jgi:hypothetical protein
VIRANPRFSGLLGGAGQAKTLLDAVAEGQRTLVARILSERMGMDAPVFLNFSRGIEDPISLEVRWQWVGDSLLLLGESPTEDLEASQAALMALNQRLADMARKDAKKSAALEKALADLRDSHWQIRRIKALLPICATCGKVRTSEDDWQDLAGYLRDNSDFLTHGVCPDCEARYYPDTPSPKPKDG